MCVTVTAHYTNVGGQENSPNGEHSGYTIYVYSDNTG
jgi:hypothetical protein